MRVKVLLICSECLARNYTTSIKKEGTKDVTFNKFCPHCGKHTIHKVSK